MALKQLVTDNEDRINYMLLNEMQPCFFRSEMQTVIRMLLISPWINRHTHIVVWSH